MWYACLVLTERNGSFFLHAIKKSKCNKLTESEKKEDGESFDWSNIKAEIKVEIDMNGGEKMRF